MIIKKKSLIVAFVSGLVICTVLVLTLIGYITYIEIKDKELGRSYNSLLNKLNARLYAKYIELSKLNAEIEKAGPLKGKPVIKGIVKNNGYKNVTDILVKVKFVDKDGAAIYEVVFHPEEPSLGTHGLGSVVFPYVSGPDRPALKPDSSLPFKKILSSCPKEILLELKTPLDSRKTSGRWSGKFDFEVLTVGLREPCER